MPQNRISICTSFSVGSRRGIVAVARGDVALAAEYAFALYMNFPTFFAPGLVRDLVWGKPLNGQLTFAALRGSEHLAAQSLRRRS